jgi:hypothetical protein
MNPPELPKKEVDDSFEHSIKRFAKPEKVFRRASGDLERRAKPRVQEHFPARIWGADSGALPFIIDCFLDNISSTGLYLRMPRKMPTGGEVRVIVHLLNGPTTGASACLYGEILRDEPQPDGRHGIAVAIKGHEFL